MTDVLSPGSELTMVIVAAVASFTAPVPRATAPDPYVSSEVSELPQTTGVPAASPLSSAAVAVTSPTTSVTATIGGKIDLSRPIISQRRSDHSPRPGSYNIVPDASV